MVQRRYSVTGQTPPDVAEALKPKLEALDTTVPSTNCSLCDTNAESSHLARGRQSGLAMAVSNFKRSPSSPDHEIPPKMARYRTIPNLHTLAVDLDTDDTDDTDDLLVETLASSLSSTPEHSSTCSLPEAGYLEKLQLDARSNDTLSSGSDDEDPDDCMEHLALSPPHSRNHSLDCAHLNDKYAVQEKWLQTYATAHIEDITLPDALAIPATPTFLTLPPEIRHQIYRHCDELVFRQPLLYCIATAFDKIQHPLAAVSRQVRSEALAIFYSYNTWTIKVEFKMMYEGFHHWIIRLGEGAAFLRLIDFSVRGTLFKPQRTHTQIFPMPGQFFQPAQGAITAPAREELYSPPDGDASFKIDLSEKYFGGKVHLVRNDGTLEAGNKATLHLQTLIGGLWEKRRNATLNGQDWVSMVDQFISFVGGW